MKMFFELAYDCKINVVGAIKEIFQHKVNDSLKSDIL